MSTAFADRIKVKLNLDYTPSVCQFRYQGFKGVLAHVPQLKEFVHFRDSMHKFPVRNEIANELEFFGIIECSKPLSKVYLNRQIIMLLESAGINKQTLMMYQDEYFRMIEQLPQTKEHALEYLSCIGNEKLCKDYHGEERYSHRIEAFT